MSDFRLVIAESQPAIISLLNTVTFDLCPPSAARTAWFFQLLCATATASLLSGWAWLHEILTVGGSSVTSARGVGVTEAPDGLKLLLIILEGEWTGGRRLQRPCSRPLK